MAASVRLLFAAVSFWCSHDGRGFCFCRRSIFDDAGDAPQNIRQQTRKVDTVSFDSRAFTVNIIHGMFVAQTI